MNVQNNMKPTFHRDYMYLTQRFGRVREYRIDSPQKLLYTLLDKKHCLLDTPSKFIEKITPYQPGVVRITAALMYKQLPRWMIRKLYDGGNHPKYMYQCSLYQYHTHTHHLDCENLVIIAQCFPDKDCRARIRTFLQSPHPSHTALAIAIDVLPSKSGK